MPSKFFFNIGGSPFRRILNGAGALGTLIVLVCSFEQPAKAYVDPGSGALIWQSLVAMLAGVGFFFRKFFWSRKSRADEDKD